MERVNAMSGTPPDADLKAADFREQTYLPHLEGAGRPARCTDTGKPVQTAGEEGMKRMQETLASPIAG